MTSPFSIAHYHVTAKIGEGGMGEVWRATDTKLARDVAIKILPDAFARDPDRLARFSREAQVLASLNHPNIAAIYGVEERALVMELVEGPTLAERIARGRIPEEEARPIIDQLVDALEYAHERGVVHRDLKPANIKLTPDGRVKVLDFGLAKAMAGEAAVFDPESSPTLTTRASVAGVIMGTAAYIAPEQARGHNVDKRADIWAFGVIVYEMLTGRKLFGGPTISDTLAAVLKESPDLDLAPASARFLLRHCLEKDPRRRLRDIGDARIILNDARATAAAPAAQATRQPRMFWSALGVLILVAAVLGGWVWRATRPSERPLMWLSIDLGPDAVAGRDFTVAISPDGTRLVFPVRDAGGARLALRPLGQPKYTPVAGAENGVQPFFSPDGEWIGFSAGVQRQLKKISIHGGPPVTLCDRCVIHGASWGEDGFIVAAIGNSSGLWRVPENGGPPQPLTKLENGELTHRWPQILPGGKAVLFSASSSQTNWEDANLEVFSLKTGQTKTVQHGGFYARYMPSGHLVYFRGASLYGMPFDVDRLEPKGPPATLLEDVATSEYGGGQLDFSRNGTLVYLSGKMGAQGNRRLTWIEATGKTRPFFASPDRFEGPSLSPDGKQLAISVGSTGANELWVYDLEREIPRKLISAGEVLGRAVWAPDGKHLVYGTHPGINSGLMWIRADGGGEPQLLLKDDSRSGRIPIGVSPDGRHIIFEGPGTGIMALAIDNTDPDHPKARASERLDFAQSTNAPISPDGRWLAYSSADSGLAQVFVRPFANGKIAGAGVWQVSASGGANPVWSRAAHQLFYVTPENHLMFVDYSVEGDSFRASKPRLWTNQLVPFPSSPVSTHLGLASAFQAFDLMPDGKRVLTLEADEQPQQTKVNLHATMLLNWFDQLRRMMPTGK